MSATDFRHIQSGCSQVRQFPTDGGSLLLQQYIMTQVCAVVTWVRLVANFIATFGSKLGSWYVIACSCCGAYMTCMSSVLWDNTRGSLLFHMCTGCDNKHASDRFSWKATMVPVAAR